MAEQVRTPMRLLLLIATPKLEEKAVKLFDEANAPVQ